MTRPGERLRALAARVFDAEVMERLIDPLIADVQLEYAEAVRQGHLWRSRWVRSAGYMAFGKTIAVCGWHGSLGLLPRTEDDLGTLRRTAGLSLVFGILLTALLEMPSLRFASSLTHLVSARWFLYLIPQALPITVPVALTLGTVYGVRNRPVSAALVATVLALAIACSAVSFAELAWVVPVSNQAFRESVAQQLGMSPGTVQRGTNELTLDEINQQIQSSGHRVCAVPCDVRDLEFAYYSRLSLSCAPFVLALLALSILARRSPGRLMLGLVTCAAFGSYYSLLYFGRKFGVQGDLSVVAAAWLPSVVVAAMSGALLAMSPKVMASDAVSPEP